MDAKIYQAWSVRSEGYHPVPSADGETYETKKGVRAGRDLVRIPRGKKGDPQKERKYH